MLKELMKERLMSVADEIYALFERTMALYEDELSRTRDDKERYRQRLEAASKTHIVQQFEGGLGSSPLSPPFRCPVKSQSVHSECVPNPLPPSSQDDGYQVLLFASNVQQLIGCQEERATQSQPSSSLKQDDPRHPRMKEEEEELCITEDGECLLGLEESDLTTLPLTVDSMKTEGHEDKSHRYSSSSEENRGVAPPSSRSPQHMTTEVHSDGTMSNYPEDEDMDDAQEPLGIRTHADNRHSERYKKKPGKKHIACSVCAKRFTLKRNLTQHMRTHTGEKPFGCPVCGKRFSRNSNMLKHTTTHTGEKPFSCSICGRRFSQKGVMIRHKRTHTGERPFCCSVCGESYSLKISLTTHMQRRHRK
nr:zinc finger protein 771-like isoform X1 [Nerophis lumbriciformis]